MKVKTIEDTVILIPNKDHFNFTEGSNFIPKETELEGEFKKIKGKRRGDEFIYRMFITNDNKIIYSNKVKPIENMQSTEVKLGADAQSATVIKPDGNKKKLSVYTGIGTVIGAGIGYVIAKKRSENKYIHLLGAALGGTILYIVSKKMEQKEIFVKKSK